MAAAFPAGSGKPVDVQGLHPIPSDRTEERLGAVDRFEREVLRPAIHPQRQPLDVAVHHVHGEPIPAREALGRPYRPVAAGARWGGMWDTSWFRLSGRVPASWAGGEVAALVHLGGDDTVGFTAEGQIWSPGGVPLQGLHHDHREYVLSPSAAGGERVEVYVEAAANPVPPWHLQEWPLLAPDYRGTPLYRLAEADLALVDRRVEGLDLDVRVLLELARQVPARAGELAGLLGQACRSLRAEGIAAGAAAARELLRPALARPSSSPHTVTATGHAHIDSAWLWPLRETRRKCARTFSNQLRLMERYPEHRFACSQAVQYQWMKDDYPELFDQIRRRVGEGRWEPVGGMWVEPDTNVPSGEALVRQFVYGKRFFAEELGVETEEMWIPDVFGYSAALPQIATQAGVSALVTQKMSWNDTNVFPHSTFWWEGHDGSRVLAHFPPADTYNGDFSVGQLVASQGNYKDHPRCERSLYPFGYGDGGGGPTASMLEYARRVGDLDGLPRVEVGSVGDFLRRVAAEESGLATWVGELYLEAHRATLTTHADVKRANRRNQEALRAAEMWSVAAGLDRRAELDPAWKQLLLQQFHDILPGSSIHWVYEDAALAHDQVGRTAAGVIDESQAALAGPGAGTVAFNAASHDRTEVADVGGQPAMVSVPACGWAQVGAGGGRGVAPVEAGDGWLDNGILRVSWDGEGLLTSVWDHEAGREVLGAGRRGNVLQLHPDRPGQYDAWDVERAAFDEVTDLVAVDSIARDEQHPLRAGVRVVRRFGGSRVEQVMRLAAGSRRLEFHTEVDWHEDHRFLKVAFPVAVHCTRATYEIQHGHIERPTVANTSWDEARFEVCGHRWADLSEAGYGVALLNDCKYGYDVRGDVMRLSLLRAPGYPDPRADRGHHRFAYALLPHRGDIHAGCSVHEEAEAFNLPLRMVPGSAPAPHRVVEVDRPGVSVEAVKWAERGDGVVVRICEVSGGRGPVRLTLDVPFEKVARVGLLEDDPRPVSRQGRGVQLVLRPFELVTLLFS